MKDLEAARPSAIIDIIHSGEAFEVAQDVKQKAQRKLSPPLAFGRFTLIGDGVAGTCSRCGYISSNELCKACVLLEGLERDLPALAIVSVHFCSESIVTPD